MSMGSNPVFPSLVYNYNSSFSYLVNLININAARRNLVFKAVLTKKTLPFVKILKRLGFIHKYVVVSEQGVAALRIYLYYYRGARVGGGFRLLFRPSKLFFASAHALRLLSKRTGGSIYVVSTSRGLITHAEAVNYNVGGTLIGFFSL